MSSGLSYLYIQDDTMSFSASATSSSFALTELSQSSSSIAISAALDASFISPPATNVKTSYSGAPRPVPAAFFSTGMFTTGSKPHIKPSPSQSVCATHWIQKQNGQPNIVLTEFLLGIAQLRILICALFELAHCVGLSSVEFSIQFLSTSKW